MRHPKIGGGEEIKRERERPKRSREIKNRENTKWGVKSKND